VTKNVPTYKLTVRYSVQKEMMAFDWKTLEIEAPFTTWFTADGEFVAKPFQQWLAANVPVIGEASKTGGKGSESIPEVGVATGSSVDVDASAKSRARKERQ